MKCSIPAIGLLFCTFFISCDKDSNKNTTAVSNSLIGTWELVKVQAGMIPTVNYSSGNGNLLEFTDSGYQIFSNNQVMKSGTYVLVADSTVEKEVCLNLNNNEYKNRIVYDNDYTSTKIFVQVSNNKLSFVSGCFALDGGSLKEYSRKSIN